MKGSRIVLVLSLIVCHLGIVAARAPIWKVFCSGQPLFRGRIDPIVNPGKVASHTHKVSGGNHFSAAGINQTPLQVFEDMYSSSCTTCSIGKIDLSAYWHPDLYYQWDNGTFSLVPNGGLTVYYLSRAGRGDQANPNWQPIPKGLRMLAGDPMRRNNSGSLEDRAVTYACLTAAGAPAPPREPNNFPTNNYTCSNGLRAQVFFPMCWDGVNLDSPNHKSHMAYPDGIDGGNCPSTHPVRIPGVFFEAFYSVDKFPHGQGVNNFVWSCGDPTGYGFHGDFLSGWNPDVMREALNNTLCDNGNPDMAFGNNVKACPPFAPYVQTVPGDGVCHLEDDIPLTEDIGLGAPIAALPGCNPITYGPEPAIPCSASPSQSATAGVANRYLLKSTTLGKYVGAVPDASIGIAANTTIPSLYSVWNSQPFASGIYIRNEGTTQYVSASGNNAAQLYANRGSPSGYEGFTFVPMPNATSVVIQSNRTSKYVGLSGVFLFPNQTDITKAEVFILSTPDGGNVGLTLGANPTFANTVGFIPSSTADTLSAPEESSAALIQLTLSCILILSVLL